MPYAAYTVELWAVIDGKQVEVNSFSARFGLNGIPRAVLGLPVGREVKSLKPSPAHGALGALTDQAPVTVYCNIKKTSSDSDSLPEAKNVKLFEGFVFAPGYSKQTGAAGFTLSLIHWLSNLTEGSAISATSHPTNPVDFTFGASSLLGPKDLGGGGGAAVPNFLIRTEAQSQINVETVGKDLWGKGIKPWLLEVAGFDRINLQELERFGVQRANAGNEAAIAALKRIEGPDYKDGVELGLDTKGADGATIAEAIAENVAQRTLDSLSQSTLWDVLIGGLAPDFMFSLVPLVDKALLVPFIPGLRTPMKGKGSFTVQARDQFSIRLNKFLPRPLRAVGLFAGFAFATGATRTDNPEAGKYIGGWYEGRPNGLILLRNAPRWACSSISPTGFAVETSNAGRLVSDAASPEAGQAPGKDNPGQLQTKLKPILDQYAQAVYLQEVLQGRNGTIAGPLRFDICPGATINVEGAREAFTEKDSLGKDFYCDVVSVEIAIQAGGGGGGGQAGTTFEVAHIRTKEENGKDATSIARHPLYKKSFSGCSLLAKL